VLKAKIPTGAGNTAIATRSYRYGHPPACDFMLALKLEQSVHQLAEFYQRKKWTLSFFFFNQISDKC